MRGSLYLNKGTESLGSGRSAVKWKGPVSEGNLSIDAGTFDMNPLRLEKRPGTLLMRSILSRGIHAKLSFGKTTVGVFRGTALGETRARLRSTRSTSDRIAAVYVSRQLRSNVMFLVEADQIQSARAARSGKGSVRQLRPAMHWTLAGDASLSGEFSLTNVGPASYHVAFERGGRFSVQAAYIRRGANYLPYGQLISAADRQGPVAQARVQATSWLGFGAGVTHYRTNLAQREDRVTLHDSRYSVSASLQLPAAFRVVFAREILDKTRLKADVRRQESAIEDSVTVSHSYQIWVTHLRIEQQRSDLDSSQRTLTVELDETVRFRNGLSVSGKMRWRETSVAARRSNHMSNVVTGSYSIGLLSLDLQADSTRESNGGLLVRSNFRFSKVGLGIEASPSSIVRLEFLQARPGHSTYYLEYRKTFQ